MKGILYPVIHDRINLSLVILSHCLKKLVKRPAYCTSVISGDAAAAAAGGGAGAAGASAGGRTAALGKLELPAAAAAGVAAAGARARPVAACPRRGGLPPPLLPLVSDTGFSCLKNCY